VFLVLWHDTTGSDNNSGLPDQPYATIDKAVTVATEATDVIYVAPGSYTTTTANGPTFWGQTPATP